jgi:hypothetical protein
MKSVHVGRIPLILVFTLVIMIGLVVTTGSGTATAALGNSGVPVRCFRPGASLAPGGQTFLSCVASDGTAFAEGQRVPTGYYLLVTDVLITPDAGASTSGIVDLTVFDAYGTNSRQSSFRLRDTRAATFGYQFAAPYFVLPATHRLEVTSAAISAHSAEIRVSGFLVTNLNYIPFAAR